MVSTTEAAPSLRAELASKRDLVLASLRAALPPGEGKLGIAFSGGVDSTLLLKLASLALGPERVVAITARSESLPADELAACRRIAQAIGPRLIEVTTRELDRKGYVENSPERCYHCKTELFEAIDLRVKGLEGIRAVAYGLTRDDLGEFRPGMRAAREHGVLGPLADAGLGKAEIRELSRHYALETWDKPAMACLASRIPYGQSVTAEKLSQVERAEALLRSLGLRELRVRHHGEWARLELGPDEILKAASSPLRETIARELRALGWRFVTLDLEGFRSGRLNEGVVTKAPSSVSKPEEPRAPRGDPGARRLPLA